MLEVGGAGAFACLARWRALSYSLRRSRDLADVLARHMCRSGVGVYRPHACQGHYGKG